MVKQVIITEDEKKKMDRRFDELERMVLMLKKEIDYITREKARMKNDISRIATHLQRQ
jgi:tetrahydromethanopterin S-methyltransferase subunit G